MLFHEELLPSGWLAHSCKRQINILRQESPEEFLHDHFFQLRGLYEHALAIFAVVLQGEMVRGCKVKFINPFTI